MYEYVKGNPFSYLDPLGLKAAKDKDGKPRENWEDKDYERGVKDPNVVRALERELENLEKIKDDGGDYECLHGDIDARIDHLKDVIKRIKNKWNTKDYKDYKKIYDQIKAISDEYGRDIKIDTTKGIITVPGAVRGKETVIQYAGGDYSAVDKIDQHVALIKEVAKLIGLFEDFNDIGADGMKDYSHQYDVEGARRRFIANMAPAAKCQQLKVKCQAECVNTWKATSDTYIRCVKACTLGEYWCNRHNDHVFKVKYRGNPDDKK